MDKKKISVKINGTETVFKDSGQAESEDKWQQSTEWPTNSHKVVSLAAHRNRKKSFLFRKSASVEGEKMIRKSRGVGAKIAVIIIGAVTVGTILGYGLLWMTSMTTPPTTKTPPSPTAQQPKEPPTAPASGNNVTLSALSFSVLQAGVFKTESSATSLQQTWVEKGFPATVIKQDNYYVIVGIGKDQASLERFHTVYKEAEMNVFKKAYSIEESKLEVIGKENEEKLVQSRAMYEQLLHVMEILAKEKSVSAEEKKKLKEVNTSLQGEVAKELKPLIGALTNAYNALNVHEQEKSEKTFMKAQQALLDTMAAYYAIANIER